MSESPSQRSPDSADPEVAEGVSRAERAGDYDYKKRFYRDPDVAADYDRHRFEGSSRARRNRRKWAAIERALDRTRGVSRVLDLPCGTARFTGALADRGYRVVASDISAEMLSVARKSATESPGVIGYVQSDAEHLPFASRAFDCVVCIRFMLHVDRVARHAILREFARVSRRWVVVDYRHRHGSSHLWWRIRFALGWTKDPRPNRVSRIELEHELRAAGLSIVEVYAVERAFSDKWVVLAQAPEMKRKPRRRRA